MRFQWFPGRKLAMMCYTFMVEVLSLLLIIPQNILIFKGSQIVNQTVISHLKSTFAKFGIPYTVMSDNGPEYSLLLFKAFAQEWDFDHATPSPNYPQSNGLVERTIQTGKLCVKKALDANEDPYLSLLSLRTTPGMDGMSPAYKMLGRKI